MTPAQTVDDIRAGLEGVTPGEWLVMQTTINGVEYGGHWLERANDGLICISGSGGARSYTSRVIDTQDHDNNEANMAHFARCSPARLLPVLDEFDRMRERIAELEDDRSDMLAENERLTNSMIAYRLGETEAKERAETAEADLAEARKVLGSRSDNAYCRSLEKFSSTPCLGWEQKVKEGRFGKAEMDAHAEANRLMGRHQAYADARAFLAKEKEGRE